MQSEKPTVWYDKLVKDKTGWAIAVAAVLFFGWQAYGVVDELKLIIIDLKEQLTTSKNNETLLFKRCEHLVDKLAGRDDETIRIMQENAESHRKKDSIINTLRR